LEISVPFPFVKGLYLPWFLAQMSSPPEVISDFPKSEQLFSHFWHYVWKLPVEFFNFCLLSRHDGVQSFYVHILS
jgi:hypothetical protein